MALPDRYAAGDWLQVAQVVGIAFVPSPYSGCTWLVAGSLRAGGEWSYSIQWLKRLRPAVFRQDLLALFDLLRQQKIKPLVARRFPLAEARQAHELLGTGGVTGKIVLVRDGSAGLAFLAGRAGEGSQ